MTVHLLLPPSEGKAAGGHRRRRRSAFPALAERRALVIDALATACADSGAAERVLGVRGELLDRALGAVAEVAGGAPPLLPAWQRYTGVVWEHLAPASLPEEMLGRILVPSGLLGLTTALDPVPDYRLKLSVSLPDVGRLDRWWRPAVTEVLIKKLRGRPVVDLLPAEHAAAIDWDRLSSRVPITRVRFVSADGSRAVGHAAKATKGRLARLLITEGRAAASRFRWDGWAASKDGDDLVVVAPA